MSLRAVQRCDDATLTVLEYLTRSENEQSQRCDDATLAVLEYLTRSENEQSLRPGSAVENCHARGCPLMQARANARNTHWAVNHSTPLLLTNKNCWHQRTHPKQDATKPKFISYRVVRKHPNTHAATRSASTQHERTMANCYYLL